MEYKMSDETYKVHWEKHDYYMRLFPNSFYHQKDEIECILLRILISLEI